jgi:hypothetical protein
MKKIIYCLLVAVMLAACGGGTSKSETNQEVAKQEEAPRKAGEKRVGDMIMVDGEMGVVFTVTTDGQHGKVISASLGGGCLSETREWCSKLGCSWRPPTLNELDVVYEKKKVINSILVSNGYPPLDFEHDNEYWTSKEEVDSNYDAWSFDMMEGSWKKLTSARYAHIRAVATF